MDPMGVVPTAVCLLDSPISVSVDSPKNPRPAFHRSSAAGTRPPSHHLTWSLGCRGIQAIKNGTTGSMEKNMTKR